MSNSSTPTPPLTYITQRDREQRACDSPRRGITTLELVVCMILLGVITTSIVPLLQWDGMQKKESQRRTEATQLVSNMLEELTAQEYVDINEEAVKSLTVPSQYGDFLKDAQLTASIKPTISEPPGRQIRISLDWKNRAGKRSLPVQLTTFVYPTGEAP